MPTAKADQTPELLRELQALPLEAKIALTQVRLDEFYCGYGGGLGYGHAYVSFSGGKDSTVLLDIARKRYPDIPAVFSNTGLEYPEIRQFALSHENVEVVAPKMRFDEVISEYGYPLIGKEVAEAIYYARRLRPDKRERETADGHLVETSAHRNRRTVLMGSYPLSTHTHTQRASGSVASWKASGSVDEEAGRNQREPPQNRGSLEADRRRKDLRGEWRRRAGVADKSLFNKEKWLPLARDIPVMISHYCCQKVKKDPLNAYKRRTHRYPIMATMAEESRVRKQAWLRTGCNAFEGKIQSKPMSFWTEQDVLAYIVKYDLPYCSVYGDIVAVDGEGNEYDPYGMLIPGCKLKCTGCDRTGCIYCGFGFHLEKGETRFQRLARTHPRQYEYCMIGGQWVDNPAYDPVAPEYDGEWKNWNPKKIWVPSKKGLGMKTVFDMVNQIYGKDFYRYD